MMDLEMNVKPWLFFEPGFFQTEVREGFQIEGLMKRAWAAQMEVLMAINEICRRHDLTWFADCGTLLGAVRHKGFVPWDDDIDISMKRQDYDKFLKIATKELPDGFDVVSPGIDPDTIFSFTLINNTNVIRFDEDFLEKYHRFPYMAGIDISPLDGVPDDPEERMLLRDIVRVIIMVSNHMDEWDLDTCEKYYQIIEEACNVTLHRDGNIVGQLAELINLISKSYSVDECSQMTHICWWATGVVSEPVSVSAYKETICLPFENIRIPVPCGYHEAVKSIYGENYMEPIRNAATHQYPFYQKQKMALYRFHNKTHYEERERWVAEKLGVNTTELFELSKKAKRNGIITYQYFCQGSFVTIDVPETI